MYDYNCLPINSRENVICIVYYPTILTFNIPNYDLKDHLDHYLL